MIKVVTFTDIRMTISASKMCESALKYGAEGYSIWTPNDLSDEFKETMKEELSVDKGSGLYCWKPYIVHRELCRLNDGDILVYCDAGNEWVGDMREAIKGMDQDVMFFSNGWMHTDWCKMDCIHNVLPDYFYYDLDVTCRIDRPQVQASTFFVRVTPETRQFIQEWYAWSLIPGMIDNKPSVLTNVSTFQEHRWDQSILCCLQIKYGYRLHWFPTTTAAHLKQGFENDKYPVLLWHHRKRNNEWP